VIWNGKGKIVSELKLNNKQLVDFELSPNNKQIAMLYADSSLYLSSINGDSILMMKTRFNNFNTKQAFKFTNDKFIAISENGSVFIYNMKGKKTQTIKPFNAKINLLDISDDYNFLAIASQDTNASVYYFNKIKKQYDLYNNLTKYGNILSLDFSKDNHHLLIADNDTNLYVSSINDTINYIVNSNNICVAEFSQNNTNIISTGIDGIFKNKKTAYVPYIDNPIIISNYKSLDNFISSKSDKYVIYTVNNKSYFAENNWYIPYFTVSLKNNNNVFYNRDYIVSSKNNKLEFYYFNIKNIINEINLMDLH